jgi:plastocyanin
MNRALKLALPMMLLGATSLAAQARPAAGNVVRVEMKMVNNRYMFEPANFSVRVGQTVEFVNVSGMPHNVQFEPGRIPAGAGDILNRNMTGRLGPLQGPMMSTAGQTYRVSFAGAPVGQYGYFCLPHKALGMTGVITVTQ